MKENNYKNNIRTNIGDLDRFLNILARSKKKIDFYAMGGTAMVLENIKESTKDIDFMVDYGYGKMRIILDESGFKEKSDNQMVNVWYYDDIRLDSLKYTSSSKTQKQCA